MKNENTIDSTKPTAHDYYPKVKSVNTIKNARDNRKMSLPCDIYKPTNYQIQVLLNECLAFLMTEHRFTAQMLLLMLFLGRRVNKISELNISNNYHGHIIITQTHLLPTHRINEVIKPELSNTETDYDLPLPNSIFGDIHQHTLHKISEEKINDFLKKINKKHHLRLSLNKISGYLHHTLINQGVDHVHISLIKGDNVKDNPALSYAQIDAATLNNTYKNYLAKLSELKESKFNTIQFHQHSSFNNFNLGPPTASAKLLHNLFYALAFRINELLLEHEPQDNVEYHNTVTIHSQQYIAMCAGYRPVTGWLGYINNYDLTTGQCIVEDKEVIAGNPHRIITLPKRAIAVIRKYLQFLDQQMAYFRFKDPLLYQRYKGARDGTDPLFFFRTDSAIKEVRPKTLNVIMGDVFPLKLNWHRHFARTLLLKNGVPHELIDAWMGHSSANQVALSQYSNLSLNQLYKITEVFDRFLATQQIEVHNYV